MLLEPPCIQGLVGCSDGDFEIGSFSSSSSSITIPPYTPEEGGRIVIPTRSSSSSSSNGIVTGSKDLFAVYTVDLKNLGSKALSGLKLEHGPVPFGMTFDAAKSPQNCSLLSKLVGCTEALLPSQTKSFPIIYKATNAASCRIHSVLQTIKLASPDATASVRCALKTGAELDAERTGTQNTSTGSGAQTSQSGNNTSSRSSSGRPKTMLAQYRVTLKNAGTTPATALKIEHGAATRATLTPDASDTSCSALPVATQCTKNIGASASTSFLISYTVQDPEYCNNHPELKMVRISGGLSSGATSQPSILSTVECSMIATESDGDDGAVTGGGLIVDTGNKGTPVIPRTGADQQYFASAGTPDYVLFRPQNAASHMNTGSFLWTACLGIALLGVVIWQKGIHLSARQA